jgi:hypothetical protein
MGLRSPRTESPGSKFARDTSYSRPSLIAPEPALGMRLPSRSLRGRSLG